MTEGDEDLLLLDDVDDHIDVGVSPQTHPRSPCNLKWHKRRAMRSLRWMSIAAVVGTGVLMDEDHKMMVLGFSTDAMKGGSTMLKLKALMDV